MESIENAQLERTPTGEERRKGRLMEGHRNHRLQGRTVAESRILQTRSRQPEPGKGIAHEAWSGPRATVADRRPRDEQPTWMPREYHWVVEIGNQVVGEIALVHDSQHTALLRHLRIDPAWQRTAALSRLLECADQFCRTHGRLRLNLEPGCAPRWMLQVLQRRGLRFSSQRQTDRHDIWACAPIVDQSMKAYHLPS